MALGGAPSGAGGQLEIGPRGELPLVDTEAHITFDTSQVLVSEATAGASVSRALLLLEFTVDGDRAWGWRGGTLHADVQGLWGPSLTDIVGDVQVLDNIDGPAFIGIGEAWIQQVAARGRFRIKVGRMETNDEFAAVGLQNGPRPVRVREVFVHSSMGFSPTVLNFGSYPQQALGAMVDVRPHPRLRVAAGVFDGNLRPPLASSYPVPVDAPPFSTSFGVVELGGDWAPGGFAGHAALGGWTLAGAQVPCAPTSCRAGTDSATGGVYAVASQVLWYGDASDADQRRVSTFVQYGWAPPRNNPISHHVGGGVAVREPWPGRADDLLGLGASWVRVETDRGDGDETVLEAFYKVTFTPQVAVQPDLQLAIAPGGFGPDTLIATLRVLVDL